MTLAVGDVKGAANAKKSICLLTAQLANNGVPSTATAGVPVYNDETQLTKSTGACYPGAAARESTLLIRSVAGSGTLTGTFTLWGYDKQCADWFPIKVNAGSAIGEVGSPFTVIADKIAYQERFLNLGHYDRLYLELASIGGTGTSFEAWLVTAQKGGF